MTDAATWFTRQSFHQHEPVAKPAPRPAVLEFDRWVDGRGWVTYVQDEHGNVTEVSE